jgi:hypothetical protein
MAELSVELVETTAVMGWFWASFSVFFFFEISSSLLSFPSPFWSLLSVSSSLLQLDGWSGGNMG